MKTEKHQCTECNPQPAEQTAPCKDDAADERTMLGYLELKANDTFEREDLRRSTLVCILKGRMEVSVAGIIGQLIEEGHMLLVPAGDSFYARALTEVTVLRVSFEQLAPFCHRFSLPRLLACAPAADGKETFCILPLRDNLRRELELTLKTIKTNVACARYRRIKAEILCMELGCSYSEDELARLFAPILAADVRFKTSVLRTFPRVSDAKELRVVLGIPGSTFSRKFRSAFGTSAGQWIIRKKEEKLFHDIVATKTSVKELARKYGFTANYLTYFCKKHFGATPAQLRARTAKRF